MPEVVFDISASRDDGLTKLEAGQYHAVISDVVSAEADHYSLLRRTQTLLCSTPLLLYERAGDNQALSRVLTHGAFDLITCSFPKAEASQVIRRALWLYRVRLTIYHRRQRLHEHRARYEQFNERTSDLRRQVLMQAMRDIDLTNQACERTVRHIETSLRVLEDISQRFESDIRDCALRKVRLL